jgi:glycosyltransferase involved in cell wall biosynthesis
MDTSGLCSPLGNARAWWQHGWKPAWATSKPLPVKVFKLFKFVLDSVFLINARRRLCHLGCGHAITLPTHSGVLWMKQEVSRLARPDLAGKIFYSPHPQSSLFQYQAAPKDNLVISVARWLREDWPQKRPALLLQSLNAFLDGSTDWQAMVVGRGATRLAGNLGIPAHPNLRFEENLPHSSLVKLYQRAKIGFWTSLWEGQQGTAAQALCCGCSVVAPSSPLNSCFGDYVSPSSGRLAMDSSVASLTDALRLEAQAWSQGLRLPGPIAAFWSGLFHGEARARAMLEFLDLALPGST